MKIAFLISSTGWGGLELNTAKLAKLLTDKGYSVTLISQEKSPIFLKAKNLFASTILINKRRKYFDVKTAKFLSNALKNEDIKTVIVFDNKDLDVIAWAKKIFFKNLQIVYQQQMQIGINKKDVLHTFRYHAINYWISPLQYLKNEVAQRTNFPINRVKIIPLCVDVKKFVPPKYSKDEALKALQIFPKAPLVGIIGRVSEKKGQLFLVEALLQLKQKGVALEVLIFGSATINDPESEKYYHRICEFVEQNKLENEVHFVPHQDDVNVFYNAVDVFVLASHSETFGMVTVEAMLSQLPIIATKSGGTSEILGNGKFGLLYAYENKNEFCEKLIWLLNNKNEMEKIAEAAQKNAIENYAQEMEVDAIDALIKSF